MKLNKSYKHKRFTKLIRSEIIKGIWNGRYRGLLQEKFKELQGYLQKKKKETNLEAIALSNNEMEERGVSNKRAVEHRICPWEGKNQRFYLDSFSKKKNVIASTQYAINPHIHMNEIVSDWFS